MEARRKYKGDPHGGDSMGVEAVAMVTLVHTLADQGGENQLLQVAF